MALFTHRAGSAGTDCHGCMVSGCGTHPPLRKAYFAPRVCGAVLLVGGFRIKYPAHYPDRAACVDMDARSACATHTGECVLGGPECVRSRSTLHTGIIV